MFNESDIKARQAVHYKALDEAYSQAIVILETIGSKKSALEILKNRQAQAERDAIEAENSYRKSINMPELAQ